MKDSAFPILDYWLAKLCKSINFIAIYKLSKNILRKNKQFAGTVFVLDSGMGLTVVTAVLIQKCPGCSHRDESKLFIFLLV